MVPVVDLKVGNKPQRTDRVYCEKMDNHVILCRMTGCSLYDQCVAKTSSITIFIK